MKFTILTRTALVGLAAFLALAGPAAADPSALASQANIYLLPRPHPIGNLSFTGTNGQPISLSDLKGKVVLLHFWSIQCPACRMAEPDLEALKRTYGPSGLEVLGVNLIDSPSSIATHVSKHRPPFPIVMGGTTGLSLRPMNLNGKPTAFLVTPAREALLEVPGFPTTYILDCRGEAVGYCVGAAQWDQRIAADFLRSLLTARTCGVAQAGPVRPRNF